MHDVPNLIETSRWPGTTTFEKNLLPSGVDKGFTDIGVEIFKALLAGDAHVIVTTSCCSHATAEYDQQTFQDFGAHSSALSVALFVKVRLQVVC
jgi:3-oxoacyl-ACP reductase-like protein